MADEQKIDLETLSYIQNCLGANNIPREKLEQLSTNLKKKEVFTDLKRGYLERIRALEGQLDNRRHSLSQTEVKTVFGADNQQVNEPSNQLAFQQLQEDYKSLETKLKKRECIALKSQKDYANQEESLRKAYDTADRLSRKNERYANIIQQLSEELKQSETDRPRSTISITARRQLHEKELENVSLLTKLKSSEHELEITNKNLKETKAKLKSVEADLRSSIRQAATIKTALKLPVDATMKQVREKIHELKENDASKIEELDKTYQNLQIKEKENDDLEGQVFRLKREKDLLQNKLRQMDVDRRMLISQQNPLLAELEHRGTEDVRPKQSTILATAKTNLPPLEHPANTSLSSRPPSVSLHSYPDRLYCLLCHKDFDFNRDNDCRAHYRPLHKGKWGCCHQFHHNELGCLILPHLFLTKDTHGFFLTNDGTNSIRI